MYNRSCYATLTYNNTVIQKRVGGNFTGLKPEKLEVLDFIYEINVIGTSVWSFGKIYKIIGTIRNYIASSLYLRGSSKYKVKDELNISGLNKFPLGILFPVYGNKKFETRAIKFISGKSKHNYLDSKKLIGYPKTDFELLKNVNGKLKVSFGNYEKILESLIESREIKGNKRFKYEIERNIIGKRDILPILISSDIL